MMNRFPRQVCVNLDRRPDRWAAVRRQFDRAGLSVARLAAHDGAVLTPPEQWRHSRGAYGCALSHLDAVRAARDAGCESVLIFEDDLELAPDFAGRLPGFLAAVPEDWAAIYLGATHAEDPRPVVPGVVRLTESYGTWAYALRNTHFDEFIALLEPMNRFADEVTRILQRRHPYYCAEPPLAWDTCDYSDIYEAEIDRWWNRYGLAVGGATAKDMIRRTGIVILPETPGAPRASVSGKAAALRPLGLLFSEVREWSDPIPVDAADLRRQARALFSKRVEYALAIEPGVMINNWQLRASLLKARDFELVVARDAPFPLSLDDTRTLLNRGATRVDTSRYPRVAAQRWHDGFAIVPLRAQGRCGTFHSPAPVLRLSPDYSG
jgi:GR25 family glycosyltransferase involved in LPS biosynthesis